MDTARCAGSTNAGICQWAVIRGILLIGEKKPNTDNRSARPTGIFRQANNGFFNTKRQSMVSDFRIDYMMRYNLFVPRLYNLCRSLGFGVGNIMSSRAFCADENQGFPTILITKHFGTFPFNHGPHAHHGQDMVIIQASHVGYDPATETFGSYCRLPTPDDKKTTTCGKIGDVLSWYQDEYQFAQRHALDCHLPGALAGCRTGQYPGVNCRRLKPSVGPGRMALDSPITDCDRAIFLLDHLFCARIS